MIQGDQSIGARPPAAVRYRERIGPPLPEAAMAAPAVLPELDTATDTETRRQPPYAVILHNDDITGMDWVILVLRKVFGYTVEKCYDLMLDAHETGRSVVWIGSLEVAELKADQIISCGPDPRSSSKDVQPIRVTIEPTE